MTSTKPIGRKTHTGLPENFSDPYVTPVSLVPIKDHTLAIGMTEKRFDAVNAYNLSILESAQLPANTTITGFSLTDPIFQTITVTGDSNLQGDVEVGGAVVVQSHGSVAGNMHVGGNQDITGNLDVDGTLTVAGTAQIDGYLTINDTFYAQNGTVLDQFSVGTEADPTGFLLVRGNAEVRNDTNLVGKLDVHDETTLKGETFFENELQITNLETGSTSTNYGLTTTAKLVTDNIPVPYIAKAIFNAEGLTVQSTAGLLNPADIPITAQYGAASTNVNELTAFAIDVGSMAVKGIAIGQAGISTVQIGGSEVYIPDFNSTNFELQTMIRTDFSTLTDNHWKFTKWDGSFVPKVELQFPPSVEFGVDVTVDVNTTRGDINAIGKITADIVEATSKLLIGDNGLIELNDSVGQTMVALGHVVSNSTIPANTVALIGRSSGNDVMLTRAKTFFRTDVTLGAETNANHVFDVYYNTALKRDVTLGLQSDPNSTNTNVYSPLNVYNNTAVGSDGTPKNFTAYGGEIYLNVDTAGDQITLTDSKTAQFSKPIIINSNSGVKLNSGGPIRLVFGKTYSTSDLTQPEPQLPSSSTADYQLNLSSDQGLSIVSSQHTTGLGKFVIEDKSTDTTQPFTLKSSSGQVIQVTDGQLIIDDTKTGNAFSPLIIRSKSGIRHVSEINSELFVKKTVDSSSQATASSVSGGVGALKISSDQGLSIVSTQDISGTGRFVLEDKATSTTYPMAIYSASGLEIYNSSETGQILMQSEKDIKFAAEDQMIIRTGNVDLAAADAGTQMLIENRKTSARIQIIDQTTGGTSGSLPLQITSMGGLKLNTDAYPFVVTDTSNGGSSTGSSETGGTNPTKISTQSGFLLYNQSTSFGIAIINSTATAANIYLKNLTTDSSKKLYIATAKAQLELDGGSANEMLFSSQLTATTGIILDSTTYESVFTFQKTGNTSDYILLRSKFNPLTLSSGDQLSLYSNSSADPMYFHASSGKYKFVGSSTDIEFIFGSSPFKLDAGTIDMTATTSFNANTTGSMTIQGGTSTTVKATTGTLLLKGTTSATLDCSANTTVKGSSTDIQASVDLKLTGVTIESSASGTNKLNALGAIDFNAGGALKSYATGINTLQSAVDVNITAGGVINMQAGGAATVNAGGAVEVGAGGACTTVAGGAIDSSAGLANSMNAGGAANVSAGLSSSMLAAVNASVYATGSTSVGAGGAVSMNAGAAGAFTSVGDLSMSTGAAFNLQSFLAGTIACGALGIGCAAAVWTALSLNLTSVGNVSISSGLDITLSCPVGINLSSRGIGDVGGIGIYAGNNIDINCGGSGGTKITNNSTILHVQSSGIYQTGNVVHNSGGKYYLNDTTDSTALDTGGLQIQSGASIKKNVYVGGKIVVASSTGNVIPGYATEAFATYTSGTGIQVLSNVITNTAIATAGAGISISSSYVVSATPYTAGSGISITGFVVTNTAVPIAGTGISIVGNVISSTVGGANGSTFTTPISTSSTTASSSTSTGALIIPGGAGFGQNINVGGTATIAGQTTLNGALVANAKSKILASSSYPFDSVVVTSPSYTSAALSLQCNTPNFASGANNTPECVLLLGRSFVSGSTYSNVAQLMLSNGSASNSNTILDFNLQNGVPSSGSDNTTRILRLDSAGTVTISGNVVVSGSSNTIPGYATTAQATYTPGTGIAIASNVISANLSAGPGISIVGNVITNTGGGGGGGSAFSTPITTTDATVSTSTATGALQIAGGAGIVGAANIGGPVKITDSTASSSKSTGALIVTGGIGSTAQSNFGNLAADGTLLSSGTFSSTGSATFSGTNTFTSSAGAYGGLTYFLTPSMANTNSCNIFLGEALTTRNVAEFRYYKAGAGSTNNGLKFGCNGVDSLMFLRFDGRLGIGNTAPTSTLDVTGTATATSVATGNLSVSGSVTSALSITDTTASINAFTGAFKVAGGMSTQGTLNVGGAAGITGALLAQSTTAATSTTTGGFQASGGAGIQGNCYANSFVSAGTGKFCAFGSSTVSYSPPSSTVYDFVCGDVSSNGCFRQGTAYNTSTGVFTAPMTGTYMFTMTCAQVVTSPSGAQEVNFRFNVNNSYSRFISQDNYILANKRHSGSHVFQLTSGQTVNVQVQYTGTAGAASGTAQIGEMYFSGHLVQ